MRHHHYLVLGVLLALCGAGASAQTIRVQREAFVDTPALPFQPAQRAPETVLFDLRPTDKSVRGAFTRWAAQQSITVQWLLADDIPLDAFGQVRNDYPDLPASLFQGSASPSLVEAMAVVARAQRESQTPFVIREYGNTIVVRAKVQERR